MIDLCEIPKKMSEIHPALTLCLDLEKAHLDRERGDHRIMVGSISDGGPIRVITYHS